MTKKQWVGRILIAVIALGLLIAAGFLVYRIGYTRGAMIARAEEGSEARFSGRLNSPEERSDEGSTWFRGRPGLLQHDLDLRSGFLIRVLGTRSFLSPAWLILKVAFAGVVLWLLYKVLTLILRGTGWQFTFRSIPARPDIKDIGPADEDEG